MPPKAAKAKAKPLIGRNTSRRKGRNSRASSIASLSIRSSTPSESGTFEAEDDDDEEERDLIKPKPPRPGEEIIHNVYHQLAVWKHFASVEDVYMLLWQGGEDVNQRNSDGYTPLAIASAAGDLELTSLLLERKADISLCSLHRIENPLHHATKLGNPLLVQMLLEPARQKGVIDSPNIIGVTPLLMAAESGNTELIKLLLRFGADAGYRNMLRGGVTALHAAILTGDADLAELLLDHCAPIDALDQLGRTALHAAVQLCNFRHVALMLRSKADVNMRDPGGSTPMDLLPREHPDRAKVLLLLQAYTRETINRRGDARFEAGGYKDAEVLHGWSLSLNQGNMTTDGSW